MGQPFYRNIYYVIASIDGMVDSYAIKEINTNDDLAVGNKNFQFDIDGTSILYIGLDRRDINSVARISFSLVEYRTKINKDVYKIKLEDALSRLVYGCDTLVVNPPITAKMLDTALEAGKKRHDSFDKPSEINDANAKEKVIDAFNGVESKLLAYWKKSYERLLAFNQQNPKPLKKNYFRGGLSAIAFGKFNEAEYVAEYKNYRNKANWLINKIAEESQLLKMDFSASCPNSCGRTISFDINVPTNPDTEYYYVDDDFPFGIYKLINHIEGSCPECGSFSITYAENAEDNKNLTCVFNNRIPEYVFYTLKRKIEYINQHIEDKLYGTD
jgi:hypothetical protein